MGWTAPTASMCQNEVVEISDKGAVREPDYPNWNGYASHYWARELGRLGHEVRLIAPQHVKPYVTLNKNDGRDAEGTCEAMSRPTMRFVPVKTAEQQGAVRLGGA